MVKKITLAALAALTLSLPGVHAEPGMEAFGKVLKKTGKSAVNKFTLGYACKTKTTRAIEAVLKNKALTQKVTRLERLALKPYESKLGKAARYARNLAVAGTKGALAVGAAFVADKHLYNGQYTQLVVDAAKNFDYKNPKAYTAVAKTVGNGIASTAITVGTGMRDGATSTASAVWNYDYRGNAATAANATGNFIATHGGTKVFSAVKAHPYISAAVTAAVVGSAAGYGLYKLAPKVKALFAKKAVENQANNVQKTSDTPATPSAPAEKQEAGKIKTALKSGFEKVKSGAITVKSKVSTLFAKKAPVAPAEKQEAPKAGKLRTALQFGLTKTLLGATYVAVSGIESIPTQVVFTGILKTAQLIQSKTPDCINKKFASMFAKLPTGTKAYIKPCLYIAAMTLIYPTLVTAALTHFGLTMPIVMAYVPANIAAWIPSWLQQGGLIGLGWSKLAPVIGSAYEYGAALCGYQTAAAKQAAEQAVYNNASPLGKGMIKLSKAIGFGA